MASPPLSFTVNVLGQVSLGLLAMTLCLPSIPSWLELFDATQGKVQLTYSAYLVTFALAQLIYGPLSDNYGRRRVLLAGLLIGLLGTVLAAMAPTLDLLILARALQGAGTCAGMTIGRAMIQDSFVGPSRTRLMAWIGVVMGLCPPLGTLIGGQLHVHFGWRSTFVFMAGVIVLAIIAAWRLPHDSKRGAVGRSAAQIAGSYRELLATPSFLSFCLIAAFSSATFLVFLGAAPTVFSALGVAPESIGWYILFIPGSYIAGNLATTRIIGWLPDRTMMALGQGLSLTGIVLVLVLSVAGLHHPLAVAMPLMLVGLGHGLADAADTDRRGRVDSAARGGGSHDGRHAATDDGGDRQLSERPGGPEPRG
ncbi:MAG: MFS transporter [Burkholderiaceae bacterium]